MHPAPKKALDNVIAWEGYHLLYNWLTKLEVHDYKY